MNSYSEIKEKLNHLPKGYISKKKIKGKLRYYLQFRDGHKIISKYIKEIELEEIKAGLEERAKLEKELTELTSSCRKIRPLSQSALQLSGDVMEGDSVVASFKEDELSFLDKKRAPSLFLRLPHLSAWLEKRSIDNHRTNSRLLRKVLRIKESDEISNVLRANAATLSDDYWFRPLKSKLKYKDIAFDNDFYSDTALNGNLDNAPKQAYLTPELSNSGSYEKCWKKIDGSWYMIKKGSKKEVFAELFSSSLASKLGIPTATYTLVDGNVMSKNFASKLNLEPISAFAGEDDSYSNVYQAIKKINESFLDQYLLLIYFDALLDNVDRHNENVGILRERKSGKIISLAPNYDNNLSLYSLKEEGGNSFGLIKEFEKFIESDLDAKTRFLSLKLPSLSKEMLIETLNEIEKEYQMEQVVSFVFSRYQELSNFRDNLQRQSKM